MHMHMLHAPCTRAAACLLVHLDGGLLVPRPALLSQVIEVRLNKGAKENTIGLHLEGDVGAPRVLSTEEGSLSALSEKIAINDYLLSVNGVEINGHEHGSACVRASEGVVKLVLSKSEAFEA